MEEGFSLRFEGDANACAKWVPFAKKKANQLYDHWKPLGGIGYKVLKVDNDTTIKISVNDFAGTQKTITISSGGIFGWLEMGKLAAGTANTVNRAMHEFYPFKKVSKQYSILPRTSDNVVEQAKFYWSGSTLGYDSAPNLKLRDGGLITLSDVNMSTKAHPMCATGILRKLLLLKMGESKKWNGITVGVAGTQYDYGVLRTEDNRDFYIAVGRTLAFGVYLLPVRYSGTETYKSKGKSYRMISDEMLPAVGTDDWIFVPFTENENGAFTGGPTTGTKSSNIPMHMKVSYYWDAVYPIVQVENPILGSTSACWRFSDSGRRACVVNRIKDPTIVRPEEESNLKYFYIRFEIEITGEGTYDSPFECFIAKKTEMKRESIFYSVTSTVKFYDAIEDWSLSNSFPMYNEAIKGWSGYYLGEKLVFNQGSFTGSIDNLQEYANLYLNDEAASIISEVRELYESIIPFEYRNNGVYCRVVSGHDCFASDGSISIVHITSSREVFSRIPNELSIKETFSSGLSFILSTIGSKSFITLVSAAYLYRKAQYYPIGQPDTENYTVLFNHEYPIIREINGANPSVTSVDYSFSRFTPSFGMSVSFSEKIVVASKLPVNFIEYSDYPSKIHDIRLNDDWMHIVNETNEPLPDIQFYPPLLIVGNV